MSADPHKADTVWREWEGTAQQFTVTSATDTEIDVMSTCPQCEGASAWSFPYGRPGVAVPTPTTEGLTTEDAEAKLQDQFTEAKKAILKKGNPTVCCRCGYDHTPPDDAADERGCGAFWRLVG